MKEKHYTNQQIGTITTINNMQQYLNSICANRVDTAYKTINTKHEREN